MKCIFAGVFNFKSTNYSQAACLEAEGCKVIQFPYRDIARDKGFVYRNANLILSVKEEKPNFVLLSKCNTIGYDIINEINKYSKTILWYMDSINSNWTKELTNNMSVASATVCALKTPYHEAKFFSSNVHFLQEGFDSDVDKPISNIEQRYPVSFIGQLDGKRKQYYDALKFHIESNAYGIQHAKSVSMSLINLNFTRSEHGCSDRVYKILAAKGFLLTQSWLGMSDDFIIGKDFDIFNSIGELKHKIVFYLANQTKRLMIAEHGYETVQKFNRRNWAKKIIEIVKNI